MTCRRMKRPWLVLIAAAVLTVAVSGCQQFWRDSGVWDLDGHRGLLLDVNTYYHRHAAEEGGRCRSPIMEGVSFAAVVEESDMSLVVDLHYHYRDFLKDGDDCDPKWRPLRCTIMRECTGFAAREFQVEKNEAGYQIVGMSGSRRR